MIMNLEQYNQYRASKGLPPFQPSQEQSTQTQTQPSTMSGNTQFSSQTMATTNQTQPSTMTQTSQPPKAGWSLLKNAVTGLGKGILDIGEQPVHYAASLGEGIANAASKALGTNPAAIEKANQIEGSTQPIKTPEEAVGGLLQTGANFATPFIGGEEMGTKLLAQGIASGSGQAMQKDKPASTVAVEGGITGAANLALGKLLEGASSALKGKLSEWLLPRVKNLTEGEANHIVQNASDIKPLVDKIQATKGDPTKLLQVKDDLITEVGDTVKDLFNKAKNTASTKFDSAFTALKAKFPDAIGDAETIKNALKEGVSQVGGDIESTYKRSGGRFKMTETPVAVSDEERTVTQKLLRYVNEHQDFTLDGLQNLKKKVGSLYDGADFYGSAKKILDKTYGAISDEMGRISDPKSVSDMNQDYKQYLDARSQFKNTLNGSKWDTKSVMSETGKILDEGGADVRQAVSWLEKNADVEEGYVQKKLTNLDLADKLTKQKPPAQIGTGNLDITKIPSKIGAAVVRATTGDLTTPDSVLKRVLDQTGGKAPVGVKKWLSKVISNPAMRQALINEFTTSVSQIDSSSLQQQQEDGQ